MHRQRAIILTIKEDIKMDTQTLKTRLLDLAATFAQEEDHLTALDRAIG